MAGGLMQLVAYGAQDVYLTGNPKVTFFQAVYKRHTNFAMEMIEQVVNGSASSSGRISVTIARNGDLIGNMFLDLTILAAKVTAVGAAAGTAGACWAAERAIQDIELTIGGQRIDKHYQRWWRLYAELYLDNAKKAEWGKMTSVCVGGDSSAKSNVRLPLIFFFNRNPGLFLPLIALQYHEVRLDIDLSTEYGDFFSGVKVWGNYVYLDTEERRRFAQKGHEYLIEQVQHTGADATSGTSSQSVRLSYNHPVKELVWCFNAAKTSGQGTQGNELWNFTASPADSNVTNNVYSGISADSNTYIQPHLSGAPFLQVSGDSTAQGYAQISERAIADVTGVIACGPLEEFKLVLNGQDRFKAQSGAYFNEYQPYQYHSGCPYPGVYAYSFALKPEEHQPTGTCNFSRIDNAQVQLTNKTDCAQMSMFACNYNVLRIQSGMGGLAFSN